MFYIPVGSDEGGREEGGGREEEVGKRKTPGREGRGRGGWVEDMPISSSSFLLLCPMFCPYTAYLLLQAFRTLFFFNTFKKKMIYFNKTDL